MRLFLCLGILSCLLSQLLFAQTLAERSYPHEPAGWWTFLPDAKPTVAEVGENQGKWFGLDAAHRFESLGTDYDEQGFAHHRWQLQYRGWPVEHARLFLHARQGKVEKMNGFLPVFSAAVAQPQLSPAQAVTQALAIVGAQAYLWENEPLLAALREARQDPAFDPRPVAELLWTDTDFDWATPEYRLAYKVEVFTLQPHGCRWVYLDALTGELIKELETMPHEWEGTAETRYHGLQAMQTDSTADGFRLHDYSRNAAGIVTLNARNFAFQDSAVDFLDADNYWPADTVNGDDAAYDVHWGSGRAYDYFREAHQRESFDGQGGQLLSFVHWGAKSYTNAFWNVYYAGYGDGNGTPIVDIDIVGHEVTHGVVRNAADLVYINEGGALNEGFADIFGNAVQHFALPGSFDWRVGEFSGAVRDMANPLAFGDPAYYQGANWYAGSQDNGGAHINCGVHSYWFYLLAQGDTGVNEPGKPFAITGIGIEKAASIAYRNLTVYLTPTAGFAEAREGAVQAAIDLYGRCSPEYIATVDAWAAVGLGQPVQDYDLGVVDVRLATNDSCEWGANEQLVVTIENYGCKVTEGSLDIAIQQQSPPGLWIERFVVQDSTPPSAFPLEITLAQAFDFSQPGDYRLFARTIFLPDTFLANDAAPAVTFSSRHQLGTEMNFEAPEADLLDTLRLSSGGQASVAAVDGGGENGSRGLRFEGGNGFSYLLVESFPMWGGPPVDPFDYNPAFQARACACVDGAAYSNLQLSFDRRQTFSTHLAPRFQNQFPGLDRDSILREQASLLRVLANGEELARYRPETPDQDSFRTHTLDLNPYRNGPIQLCFEGNLLFSQARDPQGIGDRIFLDNLRLSGWLTSQEAEQALAWRLYPNPGSGQFFLETPNLSTAIDLQLTDLHGKQIWQGDLPPQSQHRLSFEALPAGMYLLRGQAGGHHWVSKLVVE